MKRTPGAALAALLLLSMTACTSGHKAEADAATTTVTTTADAASAASAVPNDAPSADPPADAQSQSDEDKTGTGHISMTGQYVLEHDFVVEMCQVGPPGDGLLSGYHMASKDGDQQIGLLSVALKNYDKDGAYDVPAPSGDSAVGQAMTTGVMGPLTLMVMRYRQPHAVGLHAEPSEQTHHHRVG